MNEHNEREFTDLLASKEDISACFEVQIDLYDELLAVDSTPYRDTWRDHILYDCSRQERLEILGNKSSSVADAVLDQRTVWRLLGRLYRGE